MIHDAEELGESLVSNVLAATRRDVEGSAHAAESCGHVILHFTDNVGRIALMRRIVDRPVELMFFHLDPFAR
jgi:hypothetical protein